MQTASTNICERMGRSQEFSEFKCVTMIGRHQCSKSTEIPLMLNIPLSTVSVVMMTWKQYGTTATQPQSGGPRKNYREGPADAEAHSVQKLPTFCRVNSYRPPNLVGSSD